MPRISAVKQQNTPVTTEYPCTYVAYITTMFYGTRQAGGYTMTTIPENAFVLGTTSTTKLNSHQRNFVICKITQIPIKQTPTPPNGMTELTAIETPTHEETVFDGKDDVYRYEYTYIVMPIGTYDSRNIKSSPITYDSHVDDVYYHILIDLFISANKYIDSKISASKYIDSKQVKYNRIYNVKEIPITNNISQVLIKDPVYHLANEHISKLWTLLNNYFVHLARRHFSNELDKDSLLFIAPNTYISHVTINSRCEYKTSSNPIHLTGIVKYTHTQYGKAVSDMSVFTVYDVVSRYYKTMIGNITDQCISDTQQTYDRIEQLDYLNMLMEISRYVPVIYKNFTCGYYFKDNGALALAFYIKDELARAYLEPGAKQITSSESMRLNMLNVGNVNPINGFSYIQETDDEDSVDSMAYTEIYNKDTEHYYPPLEAKSIDTKFAAYSLIREHINGTPFSYQKRNVVWMDEFEAKVRKGTATIQTKYTNLVTLLNKYTFATLADKEFTICGSKRHFVTHSAGSSAVLLASDPEFFGNKIKYTGGILADSVGLGKTFSIICHLVNQIDNDKRADRPAYDLNTLIIVPPRLLKQWKYEFDKYVKDDELTVVTIGSITDIKKMYKKNLKFEGRADVYVMSSNILNNKNYLNYIYAGWTNNSAESYKLDQYFDIFRIKWNRLIIDEAHERIITNSNWNASSGYGSGGWNERPGTKADREMSMNIIFNLHANYTWAMTATPFEHKANNMLAYMLWLSSDYKTDMSNLKVVKELYEDNLKGLIDAYNKYYEIIDLLPRLLSYDETIAFQKLCISRTTKKLVSGEIKIPIFTEDIKMLDLTNIETNIYNNAKTDSTFNERREADRIRRMFQLCTNICISTYDLNAMGLTADKVVTLEELNKAMVKHFGKLLAEATENVDELKKEIPLVEEKKKLSEYIVKHMEENYYELNRVSYTDRRRLKNMIDSAFAHDTEKYGNFVATEVEETGLKKLRKVLYRRLLECNNGNYDNIIPLSSEILDSLDTRPDWSAQEIIFIVYYFLGTYAQRASNSIKSFQEQIAKGEREILRLQNQIKLFENNDFIKEKTAEPCTICWMEYTDSSRVVVTDCRHIMCGACFAALAANRKVINCPECREDIDASKVRMTTMAELHDKPAAQPNPENSSLLANENWRSECVSKYGTKMATLIEYLQSIFADTEKNNRAIVFSQYDNMLKLIGRTLDEYGIKNVYCRGNVHVLNKNIDAFKRDNSIRVIMLSSEHSNSGSNLTEASHIILVDVLNMDAEQTKAVESQAIGRAVRLGQNKPVKVVRLITRGTVEEEYFTKNKYDVASIQ